MYEHTPEGKINADRARKNNETNHDAWNLGCDDDDGDNDDGDICFITWTEVGVAIVEFKLAVKIYATPEANQP